MSKDVIIQEGGVGKTITADKLRTAVVGGGDCSWVPEDETLLTTKTISENGTYRASDDGYYGYSEVTVNGIGVATGKDGDGDDAVAYTDPNTGDLVEQKVPSSIEVVTPPTNPYGIYVDGQTITKDGMVVKAYLASGDEYGTVSNDEITINPTRAVYDASHDESGEYTGDGITAQRYTSNAYPDQSGQWYECAPGFYITRPSFSFLLTRYSNRVYIASVDGSTVSGSYSVRYEGASTSGPLNCSASFNAMATIAHFEFVPESESDPTGKTINDLTPESPGSPQTIIVSWPRPIDGEVLTAAFEIRVAPPYSDGSDTGTPGIEFDPFGQSY